MERPFEFMEQSRSLTPLPPCHLLTARREGLNGYAERSLRTRSPVALREHAPRRARTQKRDFAHKNHFSARKSLVHKHPFRSAKWARPFAQDSTREAANRQSRAPGVNHLGVNH